MLEILGIYYFYIANKKNALARGRKSGLFTAITLVLWFGFEITGFILGILAGLEDYAIYAPGFLGALFGGLLSYLIAKNCRKGSYVPPEVLMAQNVASTTEPLSIPATVEIVRPSSLIGAFVSFPLMLNGQRIGTLSNGKTITAVTNQTQNILSGNNTYGESLKPVIFTVGNGSHAIFKFKPGNLKLVSVSAGIAASAAPTAPAAPKPPIVQFCRSCGAKISQTGDYCTNCGAGL